MHFYCSECKKIYPMETLNYRCDCGGLFKLYKVAEEKVNKFVSLGEMQTPLLKVNIENVDLLLKLDYLCPTGSFKDRGAVILINKLKELGISEIVEDSSGNAGASIAAYAAAAGIKCNIYLPDSTSKKKIQQIEAYGAEIIQIPGSRDDTAAAILAAAKNTYYASHVYNPLFFEGTKSLAYELYEQIGHVPNYVFVPTGNGTMLLGLYYGFAEIGKLPKIIAVQSEKCRPIYDEFHQLEKSPIKSTMAEGIAVGKPMRIKEIISAVKNSQGDIITVTDEAVIKYQKLLGKKGIYVELTSAATLAGAIKYFPQGKPDNYSVVVPLTGFGLKK